MRSTSIILSAAAVATLIGFDTGALAAPQQRPVQVAEMSGEQILDRVFTQVERRILREYYDAHHSGGGKKGGMPPGLAKKGGVPPGIAKKGGKLPPGIAKNLPGDLMQRLPPRPDKYRRVIVDRDVVLIDAATNVVLDIIEDVIRG